MENFRTGVRLKSIGALTFLRRRAAVDRADIVGAAREAGINDAAFGRIEKK